MQKYSMNELKRLQKAISENTYEFGSSDEAYEDILVDLIMDAIDEVFGEDSELEQGGQAGIATYEVEAADGDRFEWDSEDEMKFMKPVILGAKSWDDVYAGYVSFLESIPREDDDEDLNESVQKKSDDNRLTEANKESLFDRVTASFDAKLRKFAKDNLCTKQIFKDYLEEFEDEKEALEATRADFLESIEGYMSENGIETAAEAQEQSDMLANAAKVLKAFEEVLGE